MAADKPIVIIGAGISGLSLAAWLKKAGKEVLILDKKKVPGGNLKSEQQEDFVIDFGPNSVVINNQPFEELIEMAGLQDEVLATNPEGNKRYILKDDELHELKPHPAALAKSKLFSAIAKLRVLKEPFIKPLDESEDETIAEFIIRRFGKQVLDYAVNPVVAGIFAGNPEKLSLKAALPMLHEMEVKHGSILKAIRQAGKKGVGPRRIVNFKEGVNQLPQALANIIGEALTMEAEVKSLGKGETGYQVSYIQHDKTQTIDASQVVIATPAYWTAKLIEPFNGQLSRSLKAIEYPPVMILHVAYSEKEIGRALDSFGFLVPEKEGKHFLGAIWVSTIFENRAPEGQASFVLFVGGGRQPDLAKLPIEEVVSKVLPEFEQVMHIKGEPLSVRHHLWERAIPQYYIGHLSKMESVDEFEAANPGLHLLANYRGGIAVGDCVKNAFSLYQKLTEA